MNLKRLMKVKDEFNNSKCTYWTSGELSITSESRREFKQMLEDYAFQHPEERVDGVAFMRHKNGYDEPMYGFSIHDGIIVYEPRIGNAKFLR